jgi:putative flavoprotein involved in K+ transport
MQHTDAVIIGGGQAGLAMSYCLARHGVAHVVLERGRVAQRWRSERWDSLHLLSPNWTSRLPGWSYGGDDPDGFMSAAQFVHYLEDYACAFRAPVVQGAAVHSLRRAASGYRLSTSRGDWHARVVVIATGHCDVPAIPAYAGRLSAAVHQVTPSDYRNPTRLPAGGVLVVGASATGVQIAEELQRSGRPVTIAVGRHTRLPRLYRGKDIWWWLERIGVLDETTATVSDLRRSRREPSYQLIGSADRRTLDLAALQAMGVRLVGRAFDAQGTLMHLRDDLADNVASAQAALERLLARVDAVAHASDPPREPDATCAISPGTAPVHLDLAGREHPHRRVGDRLCPRLRLARSPRSRCVGRDRA